MQPTTITIITIIMHHNHHHRHHHHQVALMPLRLSRETSSLSALFVSSCVASAMLIFLSFSPFAWSSPCLQPEERTLHALNAGSFQQTHIKWPNHLRHHPPYSIRRSTQTIPLISSFPILFRRDFAAAFRRIFIPQPVSFMTCWFRKGHLYAW